MVENTNQKNMTIDLHIKMLCIKVSEHSPVYVVWQRGNKKAKTKSRLLNENVSQAVIDEKFQISTLMDVNEEGIPIKDKMSKLTVCGDKGKGVLGEADLNLSEYQENEFKIIKLPLKNCADPDGYIEVGLRGVVGKEKPRASNRESVTDQQKDQIVQLLEDLDKEKKSTKKQKSDYDEKVKMLNEKINTLQTSLENTKTDLSFLHKQKVGWVQDKEILEKEMETLNRKVHQRDSDYSEKEYETKKVREELKLKEDDRASATKEVEAKKLLLFKEAKEIAEAIEKVKTDKLKLYNLEQFECEFLSLVTLFAPQQEAEPVPSQRGIKSGI